MGKKPLITNWLQHEKPTIIPSFRIIPAPLPYISSSSYPFFFCFASLLFRPATPFRWLKEVSHYEKLPLFRKEPSNKRNKDYFS
jgi:hypothetical protein